jgi:hypothetical protein
MDAGTTAAAGRKTSCFIPLVGRATWVNHFKSKIAKPENAFLDCRYGTSILRLSLRYIVPLPVKLCTGGSYPNTVLSATRIYIIYPRDTPPQPTSDSLIEQSMACSVVDRGPTRKGFLF